MKHKIQSTNPDILGSLAAMRRAARAARKLAEATRTPFYVIRNGRIVNLNANARRPSKRPTK